MRKVLFILTLIPLLTYGQQKEGYVDENGWKQGTHKGYSGSWLFERTYVNDTLTGPFRKYTKDGTTWETGFFKNKEHDSLWTEYYGNGEIESIKNYDNGLKNGEFKEFYKGRQLRYEATFKHDTLIGNATNYYESGRIKAVGNRRNGTWKTYYLNGQIKSEQQFENSELVGEAKKYNENGKILIPTYLKAQEITSDTSIINLTDLKVYLLFDQYDKKNKVVNFGEDLFRGGKICTGKELTIQIGAINFLIKENGLEIHETIERRCDKELESIKYGINRVVKELENGEWDVKYVYDTIDHKSSLGKIEVIRKKLKCVDTGRNPLKIHRNGKTLEFKDIDNLQFFEYDLDNDGNKGLYVLTYQSCNGLLKIYEVKK